MFLVCLLLTTAVNFQNLFNKCHFRLYTRNDVWRNAVLLFHTLTRFMKSVFSYTRVKSMKIIHVASESLCYFYEKQTWQLKLKMKLFSNRTKTRQMSFNSQLSYVEYCSNDFKCLRGNRWAVKPENWSLDSVCYSVSDCQCSLLFLNVLIILCPQELELKLRRIITCIIIIIIIIQ